MNQKYFTFTIAILCFYIFLFPKQNLAQQVIVTAGSEYQNENMSLNWTLGETVIQTFTGDEHILTQGFQQPYSFYLQQILNIPEGWSGVSTYIDPINKSVDGMFSFAVNDLIILASTGGVYYPGEEINTIGNWNYLSGYQAKASTDFELTITGSKIPSQNLEISEGWNLIPILAS